MKRSGLPFGFPQPVAFPVNEIHLRSKLENIVGTPTILFNSSHVDYTSRVENKDKRVFTRYIVELLAKGASLYEIQQAESQGVLLENRIDLACRVVEKEEPIKFLMLKRLGIQ